MYSYDQLINATLQQVEQDPGLLKALGFDNTSLNYWKSGYRNFYSDKSNAIQNIDSSQRGELYRNVDRFINWNNSQNPQDQRAALEQRNIAMQELNDRAQSYASKGIDISTIPAYKTFYSQLGATPEQGQTSQQTAQQIQAGQSLSGQSNINGVYAGQTNPNSQYATPISGNYVYGQDKLDVKANDAAVNKLYNSYFGRNATQAELNNWGTKGGSDTTVKALEDFLQQERVKYGVSTPVKDLNGNQVYTPVAQMPQVDAQGNALPVSLNGESSIGTYKPSTTQPPTTSESSIGTYKPTSTTNNIASNGLFDSLLQGNALIAEWMKDPANKAMYDSADDTLKMAWITQMNKNQEQILAGKVVNSQLNLDDPAVMSRFIADATKELDPYYQEQMKNYEQDINTSLSRMNEAYQTSINRAQDTFGQGMLNQGEGEAQSGTAFSSGRNMRIGQSVSKQQQAIDDATNALLQKNQDIGVAGERKLGSSIFGSQNFNLGANTYGVTPGGFNQTGTRSLFTPQGSLMGEIPGQRTVAINTEAKRLGTVENAQLALNARTLNY